MLPCQSLWVQLILLLFSYVTTENAFKSKSQHFVFMYVALCCFVVVLFFFVVGCLNVITLPQSL